MKNRHYYNLAFNELQKKNLKKIAQEKNTTIKNIIFSAVDFLNNNEVQHLPLNYQYLKFYTDENNVIKASISKEKLADIIRISIAENEKVDDKFLSHYKIIMINLIKSCFKNAKIEVI